MLRRIQPQEAMISLMDGIGVAVHIMSLPVYLKIIIKSCLDDNNFAMPRLFSVMELK